MAMRHRLSRLATYGLSGVRKGDEHPANGARQFTFTYKELFVLMSDGVRDVYRYSTPITADEMRSNPAAETALHMKLFRAQRNFYIAGFALFLCLLVSYYVFQYIVICRTKT